MADGSWAPGASPEAPCFRKGGLNDQHSAHTDRVTGRDRPSRGELEAGRVVRILLASSDGLGDPRARQGRIDLPRTSGHSPLSSERGARDPRRPSAKTSAPTAIERHGETADSFPVTADGMCGRRRHGVNPRSAARFPTFEAKKSVRNQMGLTPPHRTTEAAAIRHGAMSVSRRRRS